MKDRTAEKYRKKQMLYYSVYPFALNDVDLCRRLYLLFTENLMRLASKLSSIIYIFIDIILYLASYNILYYV
jgi:hypothetical protein